MKTILPPFDYYSPSPLGYLVVNLWGMIPVYIFILVMIRYLLGMANGDPVEIKKRISKATVLSWSFIATVLLYIWCEVAT